jgi:hypothetical protein
LIKTEDILGNEQKTENNKELKFARVVSEAMRLAGHVARMGEACIRFWWGNLRERDHCGDPGVDGRIILTWIFSKWDVGVWTGLTWLRIETRGGHL